MITELDILRRRAAKHGLKVITVLHTGKFILVDIYENTVEYYPTEMTAEEIETILNELDAIAAAAEDVPF